jgi:site-specific DNA recombinase
LGAGDSGTLQFQGMIAEYERAQILERSRRGKRHRARQGQINVLSGAPYGYRYVRKSDDAAARYDIIDAEAAIVRMVYQSYIGASMSIGAITRLLTRFVRISSTRLCGLKSSDCWRIPA